MVHIHTTRRSAVAVLAAALLACGVAQPADAAPHPQGRGGNQPCPDHMTEIAKLEVDGDGRYVPESGDGVVVVGGFDGGTFTSDEPVAAIVVKAARGATVVTLDAPSTTGSFDNAGMVNKGGQTPDISNVRFCGGVDVPPTDEGPTDEGPTDEGPTDEGPTDEGPTDEGPTDEGPPPPSSV